MKSDEFKLIESTLETLKKDVAEIKDNFALKKDIPDVSPYLAKRLAEESYASKDAFKRAVGHIRKMITHTREILAEQRSEMEKEIDLLKENKMGSDEVESYILYILKLYNKGELPLP